MATEADIKKVIYDWFSTASGITTIWAKQPIKGEADAAPEPVGTYAALDVITGPRRLGIIDEERPPNQSSPSEELLIAGQAEFTLNCQIFGVGDWDYMMAAQDSLQDMEIRDTLRRKQTAIITVVSPVTPGLDYEVTISGVLLSVTSILGDDEESIRDKLIIEINTSSYITVTAVTGVSTSQLNLSGQVGREYTLSVNSNLTLSNQVEAVDLAVVSIEGQVDVSELLETSWEPQKSMDIIFRTHTAIFKTPEYIEDVEITGDISGNQMTINIDT